MRTNHSRNDTLRVGELHFGVIHNSPSVVIFGEITSNASSSLDKHRSDDSPEEDSSEVERKRGIDSSQDSSSQKGRLEGVYNQRRLTEGR